MDLVNERDAPRAGPSDRELDAVLVRAGFAAPRAVLRAERHVPVADFAACLQCRRLLSAGMLREDTERDRPAPPRPPRALLIDAAYCQRCGRPTDPDALLSTAAAKGLRALAARVLSLAQRRARKRLYGDLADVVRVTD